MFSNTNCRLWNSEHRALCNAIQKRCIQRIEERNKYGNGNTQLITTHGSNQINPYILCTIFLFYMSYSFFKR